LLIDRGADINAINRHTQAGDAGLTVLDIAKLRGNTHIVEVLARSGAKETSAPARALKFSQENTLRTAIQRSIPLLQRTDADFVPKARCVSCHNNSLPAMAISIARQRGFAVDEQIAAQQVKANVASLETLRARLHQGFLVPVGDFFAPNVLGYILLGLNAEGYKPDLNTDAVAMYLRTHQMIDGQWVYGVGNTRPPLCSLYIGQTAISMRALQLYAPQTERAAYDKAIQLAANWLAKAESKNNDDRGWRLIGLAWAGKDPLGTQKAMRELLAAQQSDGGWSDISVMESTAYATGKALVALQAAGLSISHAAYERGVEFLLRTQQEDGSWYVRTRALAFQPYFEAGFPYGFDQWISAAATSWATMALGLASPTRPHRRASRLDPASRRVSQASALRPRRTHSYR
jgi:hypothetical protein